MSSDSSIDDDPLAGAPDEVLAAFVALGGRAARLRAAKQAMPARSATQPFADASKLAEPAPPQSPLINRKA
jgi:hypothetical protein